MPSKDIRISEEFATPSLADWQKRVEQELKGTPAEQALQTETLDGLVIPALLTRDDIPKSSTADLPFEPGTPPLGNLLTWDVRSEITVVEGTDEDLKRMIQSEFEGGVTSILLSFENTNPSRLKHLIPNVDLGRIGIHVDAEDTATATSSLQSLWEERGAPSGRVRGSFSMDPYSRLLSQGTLDRALNESYEALFEAASTATEHYPNIRAIRVSSTPYHNAGASEAQELGWTTAAAVACLRDLIDRGLSIDDAAGQLAIGLSVDSGIFLSIAKLRAARKIWNRVIEVSGGGDDARTVTLDVSTSLPMLADGEPSDNILRNTAATFAAAVGGADSITCYPHDFFESPDEQSLRLARNTPIILREEGHIQRMVDPGRGSWLIERMTDKLAEKSWEIFQEAEKNGGIGEEIARGRIAKEIAAMRDKRAASEPEHYSL